MTNQPIDKPPAVLRFALGNIPLIVVSALGGGWLGIGMMLPWAFIVNYEIWRELEW